VREGFQYDYVFDWTVYKYQKNAQAMAQAQGNQPVAQEEEEKPARRHAAAGAISSQRRKVAGVGGVGGVETPDTNRAVGGSDRMLRSASKGANGVGYTGSGNTGTYRLTKREDQSGPSAPWY